MGKTAEDEDGNTQQEGKHLTLAGKLYGCGHDESAADCQEEACPRTFSQASFENGRGRRDAIWLCVGYHLSGEPATDNVAQQNDSQHGPVALAADKACRACVDLQAGVDHGRKAEGEEHGSSHASHAKVHNASDGDANACQDG